MRIKLFESFVNEKTLRQGMEDALVELNDNGSFEYSINMDLYDNYVAVLIFVDESDVPDEEYFHTTKTFDCSDNLIAEPVIFLSDYMRETLGSNLYIEYWIYDFDSIPHTLTEYPTSDYLWEIQEEGEHEKVSATQQATKLMIKYKW